jgi:hypothetical protein
MLAALLQGERDLDVLANLAQGRLRAKLPQVREALDGRVQPQHLVLIEHILAHIDFLGQGLRRSRQQSSVACRRMNKRWRCCKPFLASNRSRLRRFWLRSAPI